ncbi:MAG: acyltransferase family protein, partial [Muribaculaceae bacterium]|nr:acyltransferase family protein [Muribaculaceae bacterium]
MNTSPAISGDGRILWMDAMRGFSIILVVLGHVLLRMGLGDDNTVLSSLLITFRMPLFFFVSGFFSFRSIRWWTRARLADILRRKFTAQILAAIIFFSIYRYVTTSRVNFSDGLVEYWFTVALFQMYLIYVVVSLLCRRLNREGLVMIVMAAIALEFFVGRTWLLPIQMVKVLEWYKVANYLQFFVLGLAAARYRRQFVALLESHAFCTGVIIALAGVLVLWRATITIPHYSVWYLLINGVAMRYLGLTVVVIMFYSIADYWNRDTRLTRLMNYTGRRTLDIYYIHH